MAQLHRFDPGLLMQRDPQPMFFLLGRQTEHRGNVGLLLPICYVHKQIFVCL